MPQETPTDYSYIRQDIRRILLYFVVLLVVIASAEIIHLRTGLFRTVGGHIATFLKLQ